MPLFQVENLEDMCFYRMYLYGVAIYDPKTHLREEYDNDISFAYIKVFYKLAKKEDN